MSMVIKGLDLPTEADVIFIGITKTGKCGLEVRRNEYMLIDYAEAIQIPKGHGRLTDIDELSSRMYHEAFETDTDLQKWDGGCWIRYKMFENCRDSAPTILEAEG